MQTDRKLWCMYCVVLPLQSPASTKVLLLCRVLSCLLVSAAAAARWAHREAPGAPSVGLSCQPQASRHEGTVGQTLHHRNKPPSSRPFKTSFCMPCRTVRGQAMQHWHMREACIAQCAIRMLATRVSQCLGFVLWCNI
jgi:hypothetical protein